MDKLIKELKFLEAQPVARKRNIFLVKNDVLTGASRESLKENHEKVATTKETRSKNEPQKRTSQTKEEETEAMKLFKNIRKFFDTIGKTFFGYESKYGWNPMKHFRAWLTTFLIAFVGFCVVYTQRMHYINKDFLRILEPFTCYGVVVSVGYVKQIDIITK